MEASSNEFARIDYAIWWTVKKMNSGRAPIVYTRLADCGDGGTNLRMSSAAPIMSHSWRFPINTLSGTLEQTCLFLMGLCEDDAKRLFYASHTEIERLYVSW